ncbi:hypothetical protein [Rhodococcus sp. NPDC058521]|uniref:hypothetical protein n=1 Tax=Rhodococcus sp. NPDC058521 TaxID=3346536 RepID=UPI003667F3DC
MFFFDDNVHAPRIGDPIGERLAKQAEQSGMLPMMCDISSIERGLTTGEPRWCEPDGTGRTEPGECNALDTVAGVQVGDFPDLYAALSGSMPDQVISL